MQKMPKARKRGLIVQELSNETLIYDSDRDKAHCLNETAASVWKHCDGQTTVAAACRFLSRDLGATVDEKLVWYSISQFSENHLLEEQFMLPASIATDRRQMMLRLGLLAVAVPMVTSILAPTAVQAGGSPPNCLPPGQPCVASAQCCNTLCSGGTCA